VTLIRSAEPNDLDALVALADEMNAFYGATDVEPMPVRRKQVHKAVFEDPAAASAVLAVEAEAVRGFATYSFLWPAVGLTRSLYMKELYVAQTHQRKGIGTALMSALISIAHETNCTRVEWTTDADNRLSQSFYRTLGYQPMTTKLFYRIDAP
jgi:ribosomal protein S18 acetylase RimI-like enzyme